MSLSDNSPVTASQHHHPPRLPRDTTATTLHLILLTICRSTDQAALSRWEQYEGRSWRSALAPFNAASTSNNSCLWQLCIIHLVESLSPSLLDAPHSHSPLSVSLQVFSSSFFFYPSPLCLVAVGEGKWEKQGSVPSDAACFPHDTSNSGDTQVFVCAMLPGPGSSARHLKGIGLISLLGLDT